MSGKFELHEAEPFSGCSGSIDGEQTGQPAYTFNKDTGEILYICAFFNLMCEKHRSDHRSKWKMTECPFTNIRNPKTSIEKRTNWQ